MQLDIAYTTASLQVHTDATKVAAYASRCPEHRYAGWLVANVAESPTHIMQNDITSGLMHRLGHSITHAGRGRACSSHRCNWRCSLAAQS